MRKKTLIVLVLSLFISSQLCLAKDSVPSKQSDSKNLKMPAVMSPALQRAQDVKKVLDEGPCAVTLKEKVAEVAKSVIKIIEKIFDKMDTLKEDHKDHKPGKKDNKGDPKTDYDRKENRKHSCKPSPAPEPAPLLDLSNPYSGNQVVTPGGIVGTYLYNSENLPYDKVVVVYDPISLKPVSANGYTTTILSEVPDLTGMTRVAMGKRSDGTLSSETYRSTPDPKGAFTEVNIFYDSYFGVSVVSSVTSTAIEPADLAKLKLPSVVS